MNRTPRLLFISPIAPHPADSGVKQRILHMLEAVAQVGEVDFVGYFTGPPEGGWAPKEVIDSLSPLCRSVRICVEPFWPRTLKHQRLRMLQRYVFTRKPALYTEFAWEPLRTVAEPLAHTADFIWVERLHVAHWLERFGQKMIVDVDDLDSIKLSRQIEIEPPSFFRWAQQWHAHHLRRYEQAASQNFSRLVVCSERDRDFWPVTDRERIWVIPNGTDDRLFDYPRSRKLKNRLIFVGALYYWPNEDAVLFFCQEILPRIAQEIPDVSLWIIGREPPESLRRLHDGKRVIIVANVPDVSPYVQQASISVVPLRVGGGTRLKILESLALGTPVVSTSIGAEGLSLDSGKHLLLTDGPEKFASEVVRLLRSPDLHEHLASNGEEAVRNLYRWSEIQKLLTTRLASMCNGRAKNAGSI